ncbi:uncharacterized protein LOC123554353 [Mercenaria mercenaria]|uniref:uncharacterized protein LOC123554353 n=1 Tax=Mercenaria mercenaria TaxID=6596 RepID=UPI00234E4D83|nr:uncharacterized protein LOC123554353 [Mercenaria mercenaria]
MDSNNEAQHGFMSTDDIPYHFLRMETYAHSVDIWRRIRTRFMIYDSRNMEDEFLRLITFLHFPEHTGQDIRVLAIAGFYYYGESDIVVCYCCGLWKGNWTRADDPLTIHTRLSAACLFILNNRQVNRPYYGINEYGLRNLEQTTSLLQQTSVTLASGPSFVRSGSEIQAGIISDIHQVRREWHNIRDIERIERHSVLPVANLQMRDVGVFYMGAEMRYAHGLDTVMESRIISIANERRNITYNASHLGRGIYFPEYVNIAQSQPHTVSSENGSNHLASLESTVEQEYANEEDFDEEANRSFNSVQEQEHSTSDDETAPKQVIRAPTPLRNNNFTCRLWRSISDPLQHQYSCQSPSHIYAENTNCHDRYHQCTNESTKACNIVTSVFSESSDQASEVDKDIEQLDLPADIVNSYQFRACELEERALPLSDHETAIAPYGNTSYGTQDSEETLLKRSYLDETTTTDVTEADLAKPRLLSTADLDQTDRVNMNQKKSDTICETLPTDLIETIPITQNGCATTRQSTSEQAEAAADGVVKTIESTNNRNTTYKSFQSTKTKITQISQTDLENPTGIKSQSATTVEPSKMLNTFAQCAGKFSENEELEQVEEVNEGSVVIPEFSISRVSDEAQVHDRLLESCESTKADRERQPGALCRNEEHVGALLDNDEGNNKSGRIEKQPSENLRVVLREPESDICIRPKLKARQRHLSEGDSPHTIPLGPRHKLHQNYATAESRRRSFRNNSASPSEHLADAGFHNAGMDCIRCFSCGTEFQYSQLENDIWIEHAKASPRCEYLLQRKGQDFVKAVLRLKQAFISRFANLDSRSSLYTKYVNSKQGSRTVQDYVESVTSLGRDLGKSESDILDKSIHGLRMDIRKFVVLREVKTLDELLKSAKMAESSENEDKTLRDSDQANHNMRVNRTRESRQPYRRDNQNPQYRRRFHEREEPDRQKCRHCGRCGHLSLRCRFKNADYLWTQPSYPRPLQKFRNTQSYQECDPCKLKPYFNPALRPTNIPEALRDQNVVELQTEEDEDRQENISQDTMAADSHSPGSDADMDSWELDKVLQASHYKGIQSKVQR